MLCRFIARFAAGLCCAALATPTFAGLGVWTPAGPPGGRFYELAIDPRHPELVYASVRGGFYKSTDGGRRWASFARGLSSDCATRSVYIDPLRPGVLFLGTSGGVFRSSDGGQTWEARNVGLSGQPVNFVAADPVRANTLFTGSATRLYRSTDDGNTWTPIPDSPGRVFQLVFHPQHPAVVLAVRSGFLPEGTAVFKSTDSGATWSASAAGLSAGLLTDLATDPERPDVVYLVGSQAFTTPDFGATWRATGGPEPIGINGVGADLRHPRRLWTAGIRGLLRSDDRGATWSQVPVPLAGTLVDVTVAPNDSSHLWVIATDGVAESRNGGASWEPEPTGLSGNFAQELASDPRLPGRLWAAIFGETATGSRGFFRSDDQGRSWRASPTLPTSSSLGLALDPQSPAGIFASLLGTTAENAGLFHSEDGGASWSLQNSGLPETPVVEDLTFDPHSPSIAYAAVHSGVYKSTNGGATWSLANTGLPPSPVLELAIHPVSGEIYAAVLRGGVYKSTNGGASWQAAQNGLYFDVLCLAVHPTEPGWVYVGTADGRVFRSTDGGASWSTSAVAATSAPIEVVVVDPTHPSDLYLASFGGGAHRSRDGGLTWQPLGEGPGTGYLTALTLVPGNPSTLFTGVFQGGVFSYSEGSASGLTAAIGLPAGPIVAGTPATFRDLTPGGPSERTWLFGDGFTSGEANPAHTFELPGTYTVRLRVAGPGIGGEDTETITVLPRGSTGGGSCIPTPTRLCLKGGRFQVEVTWQRPQGATGAGQAVSLTPDTGYFWFFNANNVELIVKVLNGCTANNRFWVFAGGLTNVQTVLTVTDTANGRVRTYTNPAGTAFEPLQDTGAFATCP